MTDEARIAIHHLSGLRISEKLRLRNLSVTELLQLDRIECESLIGRRIRGRFEPDEAVRQAGVDLENLTVGRFGYTFYWESGYPSLLREIHDPPFLLYHRGNPPDWGSSSVAVVGTRYPTGYSRDRAYELGGEFAHLGIPVVSGLAVGRDEAVHRGVVKGGGIAIAVLGNGIDSVYPAANRGLARQIVETGGTIVSEYGSSVPPRRYHFPARNRIIASCCRSTVLVESPARSDALITADFALDEGRDLFVHRAGVTGPNRGGTAQLAEDGARIVEHANDVASEWADVDSIEYPETKVEVDGQKA